MIKVSHNSEISDFFLPLLSFERHKEIWDILKTGSHEEAIAGSYSQKLVSSIFTKSNRRLPDRRYCQIAQEIIVDPRWHLSTKKEAIQAYKHHFHQESVELNDSHPLFKIAHNIIYHDIIDPHFELLGLLLSELLLDISDVNKDKDIKLLCSLLVEEEIDPIPWPIS